MSPPPHAQAYKRATGLSKEDELSGEVRGWIAEILKLGTPARLA